MQKVIQLPETEAERCSKGRKKDIIRIQTVVNIITRGRPIATRIAARKLKKFNPSMTLLDPTTKSHCFHYTFNGPHIRCLSHIYLIFLASI